MLAGCQPSPVSPRSVVRCSDYTPPTTSPCVLPYAVGAACRLLQTTGHRHPQSHAVDFAMPSGTPITAGRSGVVIAARDDFADSDHALYHENLLWIRHDDGTVARYFHLTQNGALADVGAHGSRLPKRPVGSRERAPWRGGDVPPPSEAEGERVVMSDLPARCRIAPSPLTPLVARLASRSFVLAMNVHVRGLAASADNLGGREAKAGGSP